MTPGHRVARLPSGPFVFIARRLLQGSLRVFFATTFVRCTKLACSRESWHIFIPYLLVSRPVGGAFSFFHHIDSESKVITFPADVRHVVPAAAVRCRKRRHDIRTFRGSPNRAHQLRHVFTPGKAWCATEENVTAWRSSSVSVSWRGTLIGCHRKIRGETHGERWPV